MQVQRKEYLVTRPHKRIGNGRASVNVCKRKQQKSEQRSLNSFVPDTAEHDRTTFCPVSLERRKKVQGVLITPFLRETPTIR